jgi:hypothetical protein
MQASSRTLRVRLAVAVIGLGLIAFLALLFFALPAAAATEYEKHADGLAVYLGVLPAQLLRGPSESHLTTMHGGMPSSSGTHHVLVGVYDERSGKQLDRATVEATVVPFGLGGTRRTLEPMNIGATTTYGNFFPMSVPGPYTIRISIRQQDQITQVQFNYEHPR